MKRRRVFSSVGLLSTFAVFGPALGCAPAADEGPEFRSTTIPVNTLLDLPRTPGAPPCECETSMADMCSLRAAVETANECEGHDVIELRVSGTYNVGNGSPNNDDAASGDLDITDSVRISAQTNPPVGATIDGAHNDRVFDIHAEAEFVMLTGLKVMRGELAPSSFPLGASHGGCIRTSEAALHLHNVVVGGDTDEGCLGHQGGGLYAEHTTLTISKSKFGDNKADAWSNGTIVVDGFGGGIHAFDTEVFVESSHVLSNVAIGRGGGIAIFDGPSAPLARLFDVTIDGNHSDSSGGGGYVDAELEMRDSVVSNNFVIDASSDGGGGLHLAGSSYVATTAIFQNVAPRGGGIVLDDKLDLVESDVHTNTAISSAIDAVGGGIHSSANSLLILERSSVHTNAAEDGAGLAIGGTLRGTNSTIALNEATFDGGGVHTGKKAATDLLHCTVRQNSALMGRGGGLYTHDKGSAALNNTIVADNASFAGPPECDGPATTSTVVVSDPASCITPAEQIIATSPTGWSSLGYSGNATAAFTITSPNSALSAVSPCAVGHDQWNQERSEEECDVGAYENSTF